jgi:hypothetical protein
MPKALPAQPHIDFLKKTARQRLAELRRSDPSAKLSQAQHDVAQEHGFTSWRALKAQVDGSSLDGRIIAAAIAGNAAELGRQLAGHPRTRAITGGEWDRPLLHLAAANGHAACVTLLLASGCDANQRDRIDRATALHWAAHGGHIDVVTPGRTSRGRVTTTSWGSSAGQRAWEPCTRTRRVLVVQERSARHLQRHRPRPGRRRAC